MCFFPLMAVIYLLGSQEGMCVSRETAMRWLSVDFSQNLGFVDNEHYYNQAIKHKIITSSPEKYNLLPPWPKFAQRVLFRFESSTNWSVERLLEAIVRLYSNLPNSQN
jgi:hypothetical protein